ncbi:MAG TPA: D-alanyl-D-alanine carboxypeptidase family protein [Kiritimatiellia bacterium]|nr:D-alanyl-D-alanine carboxypeptidase family protein [Kiritimatiellia bacterium]
MNRTTSLLLLGAFLASLSFPLSTPAQRADIPAINADPYVSALVIDAATGEPLFARRPAAQVYPASVLKLMGLYVILDLIEQGKLRMDDMVTASVEAYRMGGSQVYLDVGEQFSIEDLLYALIIQSANDAAVALAEHIAGSREGFVRLMNEKARELGMTQTTFHSVHGLPPTVGQQPDVTTARDIARLSQALLRFPEALPITSTTERGFRNNAFQMQTHNNLLKRVPGCDGLKTGYFRLAGYSIAATAERDGKRVIAVVMGSETKQARDNAAAQLIEEAFRTLSR